LSDNSKKLKPEIMLRKPAVLFKPDVLFGKLTDLSKLKKDESTFITTKLNKQFQTEIINTFGAVSDSMTKALRTTVASLNYQKLKDSELSTVVKNILEEIKKDSELANEVAEVERRLTQVPTKKVSDSLQLDAPLIDNTIFGADIRRAKTLEYAKLAKLNDVATKKLADKELDLDDADETLLAGLVKEGTINDNQKKELLLIASLGRLTGDNLLFIKALKANGFKAIIDFTGWEKADWQRLIIDEKIPLPPNETVESYAENILFNVEKTYPSQVLIRRLLNPQTKIKINLLDSLNKLLQNNDRLIEGESAAVIDWRGVSAATRKKMQQDLYDLLAFANAYRHLGIIEIVNDKKLNLAQKKNVIAARLQLLDTFSRNNPELDLRVVNLFDRKDRKLDWNGIPGADKPRLRKQLMAYQRVLNLANDNADRMELLSRGYDSAVKITGKNEEEFVKTSGLSIGKARITYALAQEYSLPVAHCFESIRDAVRGEFQHIALSNLSPTLINDLREIDGFDELFGSQSYCACEHCKSILSPAAYFVDLMNFIEQYISKPVFSSKTNHPLHLKNRRGDLWQLKLTCENTHTLIPYLIIVNEVLENYLEKVVQGDIFEKLSQSSEKISFNLPFNLLLEELKLYLSHFGISLHEIYKLLNQPEEKFWRAKINLSHEELKVITLPDAAGVKFRFGNPSSFSDFDVQEFIRRVGIDRQQLDDLLALRFNPDLGNIKISKKPAPDELQNFPEILKNLTNNRLDFIHRIIRLLKKTSWSIPELDLILTALKDAALTSSELNDKAVLYVAHLVDIQEKLKLTVEELCSMFYRMPVSKDFPEQPDRQADMKLFERIFDTKELFGEDPVTHKINSSTKFHHYSFNTVNPNDKETAPITPMLLAGLGVSETELLLLLHLLKNEIPFDANGDCTLDLERISLLYRHARISKALKLNIEDFIKALTLNFEPANLVVTELQQIHQLKEFRDWLKTSPFNVSELCFILKGEESSTVKYKVNVETIGTMLQEVQKSQEVNKVAALKTHLSKFFNLTSSQLTDILKWKNIDINGVGIQNALNTTFTDGAPDNPADLNALLELTKEIERALSLFSNLKFKEETIAHLTEKPEFLGIANIKQLTLTDIKSLTLYKELIALGEEAEQPVQTVLASYHASNAFSTDDADYLADLWKQDHNLIESLTNSLVFPIVPIEAIEYLWKCLSVCETLGINGFSLQKLGDDTDFAKLTLARDIALGAISSKYDDEKVQKEKLEPYQDKITVKKRDALCDYIIALEKELKFKDLQDVYAFFLLDVEVSGCFRTSRLVCAISSLQLYVHRCLVNLEQSNTKLNPNVPDVKVDPSIIPAEEWEWRKNYRVWEANRKVFVYPENYLEPDLRDNKTPLFKELEEELLQQKISKESAEAAYRKYVSQFAELARLVIAGSYYHEASNTYYFFGRTQQDPPQYYYRKWTSNTVWTPWEKIELSINSDRVAAVIHLGKLHIFWVENKEREKTAISAGDSKTTYEYSRELRYSFLNEQGRWIPPQRMDLSPTIISSWKRNLRNIVFPVVSDNQMFVFLYDDDAVSFVRGFRIDFFRNRPYPISSSGYELVPAYSHLLNLCSFQTVSPVSGPLTSNWLITFQNKESMHEALLEACLQAFLYSSETGWVLGSGEKPSFLTNAFSQDLDPQLRLVGHKSGDYLFKIGDQQYLLQRTEVFYYPFLFAQPMPDVKVSLYPNAVPVATVAKFSDKVATMDFAASTSPSPTVAFSPSMYAVEPQIMLSPLMFDLWSFSKWCTYRVSTSLHDKLGEVLFTKGLEEFLSIDTQRECERPIGISFVNPSVLLGPYDNPDHIDFNGAYGEYYRELFFHIPFLIAHHLNANQKFREAKWWYERIFDPTASESPEDDKPTDRNWRYIEFRDSTIQKLKDILTNQAAIEQYKKDPFNPHAIARMRISAYQKAIVMKYIDNLLDWGDYLFAQDTTESINEALMLYILAADILGKRPVKLGKCETAKDEDLTYEKIEPAIEEGSEFLVTLENWTETNAITSELRKRTRADNVMNYYNVVRVKESYNNTVKDWKKAKPARKYPGPPLVEQSTLVFCVPPNDDLLKYWDRVEDRLFKIRYCLNISGVRRQLALFQPPIEPMLLVRARAAGLSLEDILGMLAAPLPPYRFSYLIEKAKQFTQTVQNFGSTLLSALEKKDVEELTLLRSVHERNILRLTKDIKKQQLKEAQYNYQAMVETKTNVQNRIDYYDGLVGGGLTGWEITQQVSQHVSSVLQVGDGLLRLMAGISYLIPQVGSPFAMKYGGKEIGDSATAFAEVVASSVKIAQAISASAGLESSFQRREQEWKQQLLLAQQELKQIEQQQLVAEVRMFIAEKDLEMHEKNMEQADELDAFYKNKFTNLGLYNYLSTNLSRLYREAYNIAYDLAKMAERTYQFERDDDTIFIAADNWQFDRAGLLAGERLILQLQRMEKAYIEQHKRDYEVTQSFSLAILDPLALVTLRQTGSCDFVIPEIMFDLLYPGQYKRLVKSVRITIPCVAGPYTNISAKLTLKESKARKEATSDSTVLIDIPSQKLTSIATSNAQNDSGMFDLNFRDERYLPFEGAGAISSWRLELPSKIRSFDYDTLSDVIIHISYTAKDDGAFRTTVENQIADVLSDFAASSGLFRLISLKHEFPNALYKLLNPSGATQTTEFELGKNHFPYFLSDKDLTLSSGKVYLKPKGKDPIETTGLTLKINNVNAGTWSAFGNNMKEASVSLSGNPIRKWTIDSAANGLDKEELDDILILLKYTIS